MYTLKLFLSLTLEGNNRYKQHRIILGDNGTKALTPSCMYSCCSMTRKWFCYGFPMMFKVGRVCICLLNILFWCFSVLALQERNILCSWWFRATNNFLYLFCCLSPQYHIKANRYYYASNYTAKCREKKCT